jgi:pimeloyl-ACP methyl ester carboxylesterase
VIRDPGHIIIGSSDSAAKLEARGPGGVSAVSRQGTSEWRRALAALRKLEPITADAAAPAVLPPLRTVELAGGRRLRVRDSGGSGPVVVLLHAWGVTADVNFLEVMEPLAGDYRVVAYDLPGHGARKGRFEFGLAADELRDLLDALGVERAVLCGYSMGGPVAMEFGLRHPERCAGLMLQATALVYNHLVDRFIVLALHVARPFARLGLGRTAAVRYFAGLRTGSPRVAALWPWLRRELTQADPADLVQAGLEDMRYDYRPDAGTLRDTPNLPIAVLVTAADTAVPPDDQRAMATALGAVTAEVETDHDSFLVAPERYAEATLNLLAHLAPAATA